MKYIGKWKIHSCMTFDEEKGMVFKPLDEIIASDPDDGSMAQMKATVIEFTENGEVLTLMPIPEGTPPEAIEAARASGMEITDKGAVLGRAPWKEEDGVIKFDSGVTGEVLGEKADPWVAVEEDENGLISYATMKLERAE